MTHFLEHFPRLETTRLDDRLRSSQTGSFINLPRGVVHYELSGPENGPLVILVHGFSIPYYLWDPTAKALTRSGFRILRFDLYGRGYSDRPRARYDLPLFTRQLFDLLSGLQIDGEFHLAGVSMGGPVCLHAAITHPDRVNSVTLIDPAGFPPPGLVEGLLKRPLLGELVFLLQNRRTVRTSLEIDLLRPERFPEYIEQYFPPQRLRGTASALLSTIRSGLLDRQEDLFRRFHSSGIPVQLFWGLHDLTFPFEISREVLQYLPRAEFHAISDARHVPQYEHPEIVHPLMIDFLKRFQTRG